MKIRRKIIPKSFTLACISLVDSLLFTACTYPPQQVTPSILIDGSSV